MTILFRKKKYWLKREKKMKKERDKSKTHNVLYIVNINMLNIYY